MGDGGDCCGHKELKTTTKPGVKETDHQYGYCQKCECLDPSISNTCDGKCEVFKWRGDGNCDDQNNNCGCGWDGGDCCGTTKDYDYLYCTECKCLDPKNQPKLEPGQICQVHFKGDTHCDPQNNHANCDFDGGDCCGPTKSGKSGRSKYHFCKPKDILKDGACTCKDPRYKDKTQKCATACYVTKWAGDGNCDDHNNTCGCNWDGGDCCSPKKNTKYCTHCGCKDPKHKDYKSDPKKSHEHGS